MYSFIFDQTYINLLILISIVFLVMFLWRKVIILEGNFFVLEKRVNLIKKDAREECIAKNIEKSDIIMNEIFKDSSRSNACPQFEYFSSTGGASGDTDTCKIDDDACDTIGNCPIFKKNTTDNISINEDMVQYISSIAEDNLSDNTEKTPDVDIISFTNVSSADKNDGADIIKIDTLTSSKDVEVNENEPDNISVSSEIIFTSDDKKNDKMLLKKYSKMSIEKLKELCSANNINADGSKNELINRIIELKNKI